MTSSIEQKSLLKGCGKQDLSDDVLLLSAADLRSCTSVTHSDDDDEFISRTCGYEDSRIAE